MTASIIAILAALIPFGIWLWKRKAAKDDSPEAKRDEIHKAIADGDADTVNRLLDDLRLHPPSNNPTDTSRPGRDTP